MDIQPDPRGDSEANAAAQVKSLNAALDAFEAALAAGPDLDQLAAALAEPVAALRAAAGKA